MKEIMKQIREARRARGLTRKELGEMVGVSGATLFNMEHCKPCSTHTFFKVCDKLGLQINLYDKY